MKLAGKRRCNDKAVAGVVIKKPVTEQAPLFAELNPKPTLTPIVAAISGVVELVALQNLQLER